MGARYELIYEAYKGDEVIIQGTAKELADYFKVTRSRIGNCERTGEKVRQGYLIRRTGERE